MHPKWSRSERFQSTPSFSFSIFLFFLFSFFFFPVRSWIRIRSECMLKENTLLMAGQYFPRQKFLALVLPLRRRIWQKHCNRVKALLEETENAQRFLQLSERVFSRVCFFYLNATLFTETLANTVPQKPSLTTQLSHRLNPARKTTAPIRLSPARPALLKINLGPGSGVPTLSKLPAKMSYLKPKMRHWDLKRWLPRASFLVPESSFMRHGPVENMIEGEILQRATGSLRYSPSKSKKS